MISPQDIGTFGQQTPSKQFVYDAVDDKGRRRPAKTKTQSENAILTESKRRKLVATTRDAIRNFSVAGWIVRQHLSYVSQFSFQSRTGNDKLDNKIESLVKWASLKSNFEVSSRFTRNRAMRMMEGRRALDGDIFVSKFSNGKVQLLEGDRIRNKAPKKKPKGFNIKDYTDGVKTSKGGRLQQVIVCSRGSKGKGFEFERFISARHIWHHANWDATFRVDQVRGISQFAAALNMLEDTYEGVDLALAKAKVAQMFGLIFYREQIGDPDEEGFRGTSNPAPVAAGEEDDATDEEKENTYYDVDPGSGPFMMQLNDGDKAEFLKTNTPETELLNFLRFTIDASMKAFDIPYSFYDSAKVNYYGQKADIQKYENSVRATRDDNRDFLGGWFLWRMMLFIMDGELVLPGSMTLADLAYDWMPTKLPWIDKLRDMKADELALEIGSDSEIRIARRNSDDAYELMTERLDYEARYNKEREKRNLAPRSLKTSPVTETDEGTNTDDNA